MKHPEILSALNTLLPEIVRTGDAEGVLLKRAMADDLSPAQLERICQTYNTAKTLVVLEKYATDRGRAFSLIDPAKVLSRYSEIRKEASSLAPKPAQAPRASFFDSIPDLQWSVDSDSVDVSMPKAASAPQENKHILFLDRNNVRAEIEDVKLASEFLLEIGFNASEICGEKIASFIRDNFATAFGDGASFAQIEEDFYGLAGGAVAEKKAFINMVAEAADAALLRETVKRASSVVERAFVRDRTGQASRLVEAWDELQMQPAARQLYVEQVSKMAALDKRAAFLDAALQMEPEVEPGTELAEAGGGDASRHNQNGAPEGGGRVFDYVSPDGGSVDTKALADEALSALSKFRERSMGLAGNVSENYGKGLGSLTEIALGKTDAQMASGQERTKFRDRASATLAELQVRDPIISKADPRLVESLASTIIQAAPSIASDRNTLMLVLREAVQYGAVPLHTLKELAEIEGKLNPKPRAAGAPQEAAV